MNKITPFFIAIGLFLATAVASAVPANPQRMSFPPTDPFIRVSSFYGLDDQKSYSISCHRVSGEKDAMKLTITDKEGARTVQLPTNVGGKVDIPKLNPRNGWLWVTGIRDGKGTVEVVIECLLRQE